MMLQCPFCGSGNIALRALKTIAGASAVAVCPVCGCCQRGHADRKEHPDAGVDELRAIAAEDAARAWNARSDRAQRMEVAEEVDRRADSAGGPAGEQLHGVAEEFRRR